IAHLPGKRALWMILRLPAPLRDAIVAVDFREGGARPTRPRRALQEELTIAKSSHPIARGPAMWLAGLRLLTSVSLLVVCETAAPAAATPGLRRPGYALSQLSPPIPAT